MSNVYRVHVEVEAMPWEFGLGMLESKQRMLGADLSYAIFGAEVVYISVLHQRLCSNIAD